MHPVDTEALTGMGGEAFKPNNAVEQTAGSHSLAAAAHRERSADSGTLKGMIGSVHGTVSARAL
jgi:hypothetical protein